MSLKINDRVKFNTNYSQNEVLVGELGTVTMIGANGLVLVETDDESYGVVWVSESQLDSV